MAREDDPAIVDQAIDWHIRQAEMAEGDWRDLIVWLEQSPAHARAFDRVALSDRLLAASAFPAVAANDDIPLQRRWPKFAGAAAVAALALALVVPMVRQASPQGYVVETQPGERRVVQLADDTRIELGGGSRLKLDHADARVAELEAGEALFTVRHDAAHPFTLKSGNLTIRDLGTVFDVARDGTRLDLQVRAGSVLFQPDREAVVLAPGDALVVREDRNQIIRARIPVETIGGWREGRFSFDGDSLQTLAEAIHRNYGTNIVLAGSLAGRPFTGMIQFTGSAERDIPHLAAMIGAGWRKDGETWTLSPRAGRTR